MTAPALAPVLGAMGLAALGLLAPAPAAAGPEQAAPATDLVAQRLQPLRRQLWLGASVELDASKQRGGSVALAPDLHLGLSDRTTLAVTHSSASIARIGKVGGLCIDACDVRPGYAVAVLGQHLLVDRPRLALAALAGALVRDVTPWKPAALAGARARWHRGRWGLDGTGYLQLGLANTDQGNRHRLVLSARAWLQPTCRWALGLASGAEGELAVLSEGYHVPLVALLAVRLSTRLTLTVEAGFPMMLGPQNTSRNRNATLGFELRR